ncbi:MAG: helix-hairpin-helix domain-containing protein, partial [Actinomycetales bacterium]|nr:helix-hairpin-helix domain-containing protein [Actinomycetales bacterium]
RSHFSLPSAAVTDDPNLEPLSDDPRLNALTGDPRARSEPEALSDHERAAETATLLEVNTPEARRLQLFALAAVLGVLVLLAGVRSFTGRALAAPMPAVTQVADGVMAQPQSASTSGTLGSAANGQPSPVFSVAAGTANLEQLRDDALSARPAVTAGPLRTSMPARPTISTTGNRDSRRAVVVDPTEAQGVGNECSASQARVALNAATLAQLDSLPGVGPVLAARILAWRTRHRGFSDVHELQEVPGIGPTKFAKLRPRVTL